MSRLVSSFFYHGQKARCTACIGSDRNKLKLRQYYYMKVLENVMPREKKMWSSGQGLLALISRAYRNFSLWHHEFIKSTALVVLRFIPTRLCSGYQVRSTCGSELMRFISTRLCYR